MQDKILITGVSGLLGSKLALKYKKEGYDVVGTKRIGTAVPEELLGIEIFEGDICDEVFLDECFQNIDIVIHTAALVSFDRRDKAELFRINTEGTKTVVDSCLKRSVNKLIYISSVAALGRSNTPKVIDETQQWEESDYNTNYGYSKFLGEVEFWRGVEEGLNGFCVNPSVILGCGDIDKSSNKLFKNRFKKFVPFASGSINVVDERDVLEIIYDLHVKNVNHEKYIINGHKVNIETLLKNIIEGTNAKMIRTSKRLVKLGLILDGFFSFLRGIRPQITRETLKVLGAESDYSNDKVIHELNVGFKTIKETLDYCNKFYIEKYK